MTFTNTADNAEEATFAPRLPHCPEARAVFAAVADNLHGVAPPIFLQCAYGCHVYTTWHPTNVEGARGAATIASRPVNPSVLCIDCKDVPG